MAQSVKKTATTANQSKTVKRIVQVKAKRKNAKKIVEIVTLAPIVKAKPSDKPRQTKSQTKAANSKAYNDKQDVLRINGETIEEHIRTNTKTGLSYWKELGLGAIEYRTNWIANGGDIKARGDDSFATYRTSFQDAYGRMDKNKFNEIIMIAQNWDAVLKMDTTDSLEKVGFNSCIKAIRASKKVAGKQGPATSSTTKKTKAKLTAKQLIKATLKTAQENDIALADVLIELKNQLTATVKS